MAIKLWTQVKFTCQLWSTLLAGGQALGHAFFRGARKHFLELQFFLGKR